MWKTFTVFSSVFSLQIRSRYGKTVMLEKELCIYSRLLATCSWLTGGARTGAFGLLSLSCEQVPHSVHEDVRMEAEWWESLSHQLVVAASPGTWVPPAGQAGRPCCWHTRAREPWGAPGLCWQDCPKEASCSRNLRGHIGLTLKIKSLKDSRKAWWFAGVFRILKNEKIL